MEGLSYDRAPLYIVSALIANALHIAQRVEEAIFSQLDRNREGVEGSETSFMVLYKLGQFYTDAALPDEAERIDAKRIESCAHPTT